MYLSSAAVLEKWLRNVALPIAGGADAEVRSGIALCVVVQLLTIVNSGLVEAGQLAIAIGRHLSLHKAAYDLSLWLPKTHFTIHLPDTLRRHKCLLSVFVQERKHRTVKTMATGRHTTVSYNRGLMEEVTVQHLYQLRMPLIKASLMTPKPANKKVRCMLLAELNYANYADGVIHTSRDAHIHCRVVSVGDVVAVGPSDTRGAMRNHPATHASRPLCWRDAGVGHTAWPHRGASLCHVRLAGRECPPVRHQGQVAPTRS